MSVREIGDAILFLSIIPSYALLWYLSKVPWWRSPLGRGLFGLKFSLATMLTLILVRVLFGGEDARWYEWARLVVFTLVFLSLVTQARAFRQILVRAMVQSEVSTPSHKRSSREDPTP